MMVLIGGAPRCGKTTVARRLAQATCCSRVPADYLGTAFTNYIPPAELPHRYPTFPLQGDARFARFSPAELITQYQTKAETVWPGIRDFVVYALYDIHDMVVEGYQIEPRFAHELIATYPQFAIKAAFLCRAQVDGIAQDLKKGTDPEDWVVKQTREEGTFTRVAEMVSKYSAYFRDEAAKYALPAFDMDDNFLERIDQVVGYLRKEWG